MEKEKLTVNDEELIELAYSTTYRSSIRTMIQEADTERCRVILRDIIDDAGVSGKIERDKGTADIRQSLSMWKNICGRLCSPELSFYRFSSTPAHRRTPAKPGTPIPYVPFQSGRPPAQGERGPAECVMLPHTACR